MTTSGTVVPQLNGLTKQSIVGITGENIIINGNFDIWQRGTSQTGYGYGSADRWANVFSGTSQESSRESFVVGQIEVPNNPKYFSRTVIVDNENLPTVPAESDFAIQAYQLEGVETLSNGGNMNDVTLSFWARSDANRLLSIEFLQNFGSGIGIDPTVSGIGVSTLQLTTNWQHFYVSTTLPSISGKVLGVGHRIQIFFWMDSGSDFNTRNNNLGHQSGVFDIAQVQFESGKFATQFGYRHISDELELCQRYYEKSYNPHITPGAVTSDGVLQGHKPQIQDTTVTITLPITFVPTPGFSWIENILSIPTNILNLSPRFRTIKQEIPDVILYSPVTGNGGQVSTTVGDVPSIPTNIGQGGCNVEFNVADIVYGEVTVHWTADAEFDI